MWAILTAILVHQLYDISVHYFRFESHIIIDAKTYQSDRNYPYISLVTLEIPGLFCLVHKVKRDCQLNVTNEQLFNGTLYGTHYLSGKNITNLIKSVKSYYYPVPLYNIHTLYINESVWIIIEINI